MTSKFGEQLLEHRLSLSTVAQDLHADGYLTPEDLVRIGLSTKLKIHPRVFLAEQRKERENEDEEAYQHLSDAYNAFLLVVLAHADLHPAPFSLEALPYRTSLLR